MSSSLSYLCPEGYDCTGKSSCPTNTLECPIGMYALHFFIILTHLKPFPPSYLGYYCGSYQGHPQQTEIDKGYAFYKSLFTADSVTDSNYLDFIEPNRQIQSLCIRG
jgi:hypothetical protein